MHADREAATTKGYRHHNDVRTRCQEHRSATMRNLFKIPTKTGTSPLDKPRIYSYNALSSLRSLCACRFLIRRACTAAGDIHGLPGHWICLDTICGSVVPRGSCCTCLG